MKETQIVREANGESFVLGTAYFRHYPLNIYENCFCCSFIHFAVVLKFSLALHAVLFILFFFCGGFDSVGAEAEAGPLPVGKGSKTIKLKISIS